MIKEKLGWPRLGLIIFLLFIIVGLNGLIIQKELLLAQGEPVYWGLLPIDPRSLIQGDYMILRYEFVDGGVDATHWPQNGQIAVQLNPQRIVTDIRLHTANQPLGPNEIIWNYQRISNNEIKIGANSFLFQEGLASLYDQAEYAEFRVTPNGDSLLVDLRDENLRLLQPQ
ncbi:MAG TPA: GDYXXLXY domain-containing protein [Anaerolineae bacterium]|nr:GDYXXLXY domain-containing protein [Anaerolineae bacterium]